MSPPNSPEGDFPGETQNCRRRSATQYDHFAPRVGVGLFPQHHGMLPARFLVVPEKPASARAAACSTQPSKT